MCAPLDGEPAAATWDADNWECECSDADQYSYWGEYYYYTGSEYVWKYAYFCKDLCDFSAGEVWDSTYDYCGCAADDHWDYEDGDGW